MRLIDADALADDLRDYLYDDDELQYSKNRDSDKGYNNGLKCAIRRIKFHAPTIDADIVKHGHWGEYETHPLAHSLDGFPCSVCGVHQDDIRGLNYCPNCGADMDGGYDG